LSATDYNTFSTKITTLTTDFSNSFEKGDFDTDYCLCTGYSIFINNAVMNSTYPLTTVGIKGRLNSLDQLCNKNCGVFPPTLAAVNPTSNPISSGSNTVDPTSNDNDDDDEKDIYYVEKIRSSKHTHQENTLSTQIPTIVNKEKVDIFAGLIIPKADKKK